jgi:hypothetical protein
MRKAVASMLVAGLLLIGAAPPASASLKVYSYGDEPSYLCWSGSCSGSYQLKLWLTRHCKRYDTGHTWTVYGGAEQNTFYVEYMYSYWNPSSNRWVHKYDIYSVWSHDFSLGKSGASFYGSVFRYC